MTIEDKYKKLDQIDHILLRAGRYIGNINNHTADEYVFVGETIQKKKVTYNPGFLKLFDEIITNAVDHSKSKEGSNLTTIKVEIKDAFISVWDNGGIPVVKHKEYKQYIPEMIFGELYAGSNFNDNDLSEMAGQNGEGASLVNVFSHKFIVETADGKKQFKQIFVDNMKNKSMAVVNASDKKFTKITYHPEFHRFGMTDMNDNDTIDMLTKRVYEIAGCNPKLRIYLDGVLIKIKSFKDYVGMFGHEEVIFFENDKFTIGFTVATDGFEQISYVNSTNTFDGGSHIDYIMSELSTDIREYIKKKNKVDVKPSDIKNNIMLFMNASIVNPRYNSQTKEKLITEAKTYQSTFPDIKINKIINSEILKQILEWVEAKQRQQELKQLRQMNKASQSTNALKRIEKFDDASTRIRANASIFFAEGDSAAKPLVLNRNAKLHGVFPLKGKPLNVRDLAVTKLVNNQEFSNISTILGLQIGDCDNLDNLRYGKIVIAADADKDGKHIVGLMLNMFNEFWKPLLSDGHVYLLKTPVIVAKVGKKEHEFFTEKDYKAWSKTAPKHSHKYYKGLGTWDNKSFKKFMKDDMYLEQLSYEDADDQAALDMAFDHKKADDRKEWLITI